MEPHKATESSLDGSRGGLEREPETLATKRTIDGDDSDDESDDLDGWSKPLGTTKEMYSSTYFLPFATIDLLDEFEGPSKAATKSSKAGVQGVPKYDSAASVDDDFARQLQLGMQDLLGEIQDSVR